MVVLLATFIGVNYGANLALFPSIAKDLWGFAEFWDELRGAVHSLGVEWVGLP